MANGLACTCRESWGTVPPCARHLLTTCTPVGFPGWFSLFSPQLTHENIIKLVDLFCSPQGDMYIITEAMDCDLGRILSGDPGTFELLAAHVKWIMYQLLRGLRYLHSGGVLHRDLKPQNILVNQAMSIRICDLGLARTNQQQDGLATGYVTTRWYRAPEVMLTWQHYTNALDMWSAGCIFAEMLNRANGNVTFQDSQGQTYFALFPSESHDEHLKRIIQFVGAPSAQIVANIGVAAIRDFVQGTIEEMKAQPARSLAENMNLQDQDAAFLLMQLLDWDPLRRLSANDAVQVPYIQEYREDDAGDARGPVDTQFEELDVPVEMWRQVIETEIGNLEAVEATGLSAAQMAQTDILEAALAAETVDLPSPTLLAGEMNALSMDASLPEMSAQGAATSMPVSPPLSPDCDRCGSVMATRRCFRAGGALASCTHSCPEAFVRARRAPRNLRHGVLCCGTPRP